MKFIVILFGLALIVFPASSYAVDWDQDFGQWENDLADSYEEEERAPARKVRSKPPKLIADEEATEPLVNLDSSRASSRIAQLERRLSSVERENRFQSEQIKRLSRLVGDLKRRR